MSSPKQVRQSPPLRDSDVMFVISKRFEQIGQRMIARDYTEVEALMQETSEWMDWLHECIQQRDGGDS